MGSHQGDRNMITQIASYVAGTALFVLVCNLLEVDAQLMLMAIQDATHGTWGLPQVKFLFKNS